MVTGANMWFYLCKKSFILWIKINFCLNEIFIFFYFSPSLDDSISLQAFTNLFLLVIRYTLLSLFIYGENVLFFC